jgi:hypothetical protein
LRTARDPAARRAFPPAEEAQVKQLACERARPADPQAGVGPLARLSVFDVVRRAWDAGFTKMSYSTAWRLLHRDALRPWFQKQWLFPQDPLLRERAQPVLDLYAGVWEGEPLGPEDVVLSGDELTNLVPRTRHHETLPPGPGRPGRYEHGHDRDPARLVYLALLNVRTGQVAGLVEERNGIASFETLVKRELSTPQLARARRIFLILDNGSAHHPSTSPARLAALDSRLTAVHLPVHSSWLNQVEIYFSIVKRKALTPNDLPDAPAVRRRLMSFECYYNGGAEPFRWRFTREHLDNYLKRLELRGCWPPEPRPGRNPLTVH